MTTEETRLNWVSLLLPRYLEPPESPIGSVFLWTSIDPHDSEDNTKNIDNVITSSRKWKRLIIGKAIEMAPHGAHKAHPEIVAGDLMRVPSLRSSISEYIVPELEQAGAKDSASIQIGMFILASYLAVQFEVWLAGRRPDVDPNDIELLKLRLVDTKYPDHVGSAIFDEDENRLDLEDDSGNRLKASKFWGLVFETIKPIENHEQD